MLALLQENSISFTFFEALLSLGVCKSPEDFCNLEHSGRDPPIVSPSWTCQIHHTSLPWRWHFCCLQAKHEHRRSLSRPRVSVSGVRTPSAQPIIIPIRGPACSLFLELIKFFCPTVLVLWGSSLKFLLCPFPKGCLSQLKSWGWGRLCYKRAWKLLLPTTFLGWRRRNYPPLWGQKYRFFSVNDHIYTSNMFFTLLKQNLISGEFLWLSSILFLIRDPFFLPAILHCQPRALTSVPIQTGVRSP